MGDGLRASTFFENDIAIVGEAIVLDRVVDPDQLWFPFMRGVIFKTPPPQDPMPKRSIVHKHGGKMQTPKTMYRFIEGVDQIPLPFFEHREVSRRQYREVLQSRHAGWDRDRSGDPIKLHFSPYHSTRDALRQWCLANAKGLFHISREFVVLSEASDAMKAKFSLEYVR